MIELGLLLGVLLSLPIAWLLGMFNPIGYLGYRPWDPRVKAARKRQRDD